MNKAQEFITIKGNTIESALTKIVSGSVNNHTIIIPHVCNNVGLFGAGFAKAIAEQFPIVKENFHLLGRTDSKLGRVQFVTAVEHNQTKNKIIVANMIAQNGVISHKNKRPLNYAALAYCMGDVRKFYANILSPVDDRSVEIHAPKFGSGLSGGNWNFIAELINDVWNDINVYVYIHNTSHKTERVR
jgi:hypothetical protein